MKIAVIGYSGSGKSTLAVRLGDILDIPVLHLDKVNFLPGWQERERSESRSIVAEFMLRESWIIDGNYSAFWLSERLEQADRIVFMNFSRASCFFRALSRYFRYRNGAARESMTTGCAEKFDWEFARWLLIDGRSKERRARFRAIAEKYAHKTTVLSNQKQLDAFVKSAKSDLW